MKKLIRLTEGDLHRIIENSVKRALNEVDWRTYANYARGREAQANGQRPLSPAQQRVQARPNNTQTLQRKAYQGNRASAQAYNNNYDTTNYKMDFRGNLVNNRQMPNGINQNTVLARDVPNYGVRYFDNGEGEELNNQTHPQMFNGDNDFSNYQRGDSRYINGQWQ